MTRQKDDPRALNAPPVWPAPRVHIWYPLFDRPAEVLISIEQLEMIERSLRRERVSRLERKWWVGLADQIAKAFARKNE